MGKYGTKSFLQAFCQNSEQLKGINYFNKKAPSLMFHILDLCKLLFANIFRDNFELLRRSQIIDVLS